MIAATRLRKGPSNSARGAASIVAETIHTARACGASGLLVMRADSAYYGADVVKSCRALGARISITVQMNASVKAAIARIDADAWTPIKYPKAVWDEEGQCWISDAEIAETGYTAFTSKLTKQQVTARLIVRRVKRLGTGTVPPDRARCSTPGATTPRSPTPRSPCTIPSVITDGPPGRPARPAASPCTYPNARPGARTSPSSSAPHMRYQAPDAPRPTCPKGPDTCGRVEELGRPAATPHPNPRLNPDTAHTTPKRPPRNQPVDPGSVHLHPDTSRKQTCGDIPPRMPGDIIRPPVGAEKCTPVGADVKKYSPSKPECELPVDLLA
ncbi:hypothetical protein OHA27_36015 [Streptomyces sp. NBC_01619]|uniref:hypothetical protein n=1 Tax=Streptomyces sp. NBC_01619 TaxID=2975901 RepID=UPI0022514AE5|nr:hypothetical protein [Streptomyces sp. NBC_01619]MCX4515617.1 hypothetical protein [Streptomyces sp. NBC_01619]